MKNIAALLSLLSIMLLATTVPAINKGDISKNVDNIVSGLEAGKKAEEFKSDAYEPYAFIMKEDGVMIVHPSLAGKSLKEKAQPVFDALSQATPGGVWVQYTWKGKVKNTYAKKTTNNLIVGSGY